MSQQVNLYELRLRPRELFLTGERFCVALLSALVLTTSMVVVMHKNADRLSAEAARVEAEVKVLQEKHDGLVKQLAEKQIPPALQADLDRAKALLSARTEAVSLLDSGKLGDTDGFSGLLLGFSRQAASDWWLTQFSVGMGGQEIEIRGKVIDAGKLPTYVQRLSQDSAFQGKRFAALKMSSVDFGEQNPESDRLGKKSEQPLRRHLDFVLRTENGSDLSKSSGTSK